MYIANRQCLKNGLAFPYRSLSLTNEKGIRRLTQLNQYTATAEVNVTDNSRLRQPSTRFLQAHLSKIHSNLVPPSYHIKVIIHPAQSHPNEPLYTECRRKFLNQSTLCLPPPPRSGNSFQIRLILPNYRPLPTTNLKTLPLLLHHLSHTQSAHSHKCKPGSQDNTLRALLREDSTSRLVLGGAIE